MGSTLWGRRVVLRLTVRQRGPPCSEIGSRRTEVFYSCSLIATLPDDTSRFGSTDLPWSEV